MTCFHDALESLSRWTSDSNLFPLIQVGLCLFTLFAAIKDYVGKIRAGSGGVTLQVTRGEASMNRFYALYAALNGILIGIILTVDVIKGHRIFWFLFDTSLLAYLCFLNIWLRNRIITWANNLSKVEKR
jgi:hypothetical protein